MAKKKTELEMENEADAANKPPAGPLPKLRRPKKPGNYKRRKPALKLVKKHKRPGGT